MSWWGWIATGAILLGAELAFIDAQFYLVFVGSSALIVGLLAMAGILSAPWLQWGLFAALAVITMLTFRRSLYARMRARLPVVKSGLAGELVDIATPLAPQALTRIEYRGSSWNCLNAGDQTVGAGVRARIERVDGLTLIVRAAH